MSPCRPQHRGTPCRSSAPHLATRPLLRALLLPQSASRSSVLFSVSSFSPSSLTRLLWLLLTSDSASADLSIRVAQRHAVRSPRVLRTHLHAYACRIYAASFRASIGLRPSLPSYPDAPPRSASCSSGQRFAHSFLRTPGHPRNPCCSANTSSCQACRGLPPPSKCALPGAQRKRPATKRLPAQDSRSLNRS